MQWCWYRLLDLIGTQLLMGQLRDIFWYVLVLWLFLFLFFNIFFPCFLWGLGCCDVPTLRGWPCAFHGSHHVGNASSATRSPGSQGGRPPCVGTKSSWSHDRSCTSRFPAQGRPGKVGCNWHPSFLTYWNTLKVVSIFFNILNQIVLSCVIMFHRVLRLSLGLIMFCLSPDIFRFSIFRCVLILWYPMYFSFFQNLNRVKCMNVRNNHDQMVSEKLVCCYLYWNDPFWVWIATASNQWMGSDGLVQTHTH